GPNPHSRHCTSAAPVSRNASAGLPDADACSASSSRVSGVRSSRFVRRTILPSIALLRLVADDEHTRREGNVDPHECPEKQTADGSDDNDDPDADAPWRPPAIGPGAWDQPGGDHPEHDR